MQEPITTTSLAKAAEAVDNSLMNGSALYELNQIAKELFIEPKWSLSPAGGRNFLYKMSKLIDLIANGQFEAEVVFDKLTAIGKGRKKDDVTLYL